MKEFLGQFETSAYTSDYHKLHSQLVEDEERDLRDYPEQAINVLLGITEPEPEPTEQDKDFLNALKKWKERTQNRNNGTFATTPKTIGVEINPRPFHLNPYENTELGGIWEEPFRRNGEKITAVYDKETGELIGTETIKETTDIDQETIKKFEELIQNPVAREIWNNYKDFNNITSMFDLTPTEAKNLISVFNEEIREANND